MDSENPQTRAFTLRKRQFEDATDSPRPGIDGYYSGDGIVGSRSDDSLLHRAIASSSAFGSNSLETFGWPKPRCMNQTSRNSGKKQNRNQARPIHDAFSPSSGNRIVQNFSQICLNSDTPSGSGHQMELLPQSNGASDMDMNWRSGSSLTKTPGEALELNETFLAQVRAFPNLPLHIHKQIHQTSGNQIINHFDVNLLRVHDENIVGSTESVAVFTTKSGTDQCWLMAFMKKSDDNALRFNRLLKPDLDYKIIGANAIEIDSSKLNAPETIKFIFNFGSMETAAEFVQLLEQLKKKSLKSPGRISLKKTWRNVVNRNSLLSTALAEASDDLDEEYSSSSYSPGNYVPRVQGVRYIFEDASIFIQKKTRFESLGYGILKILHNGNSFDKLVFLTGEDPSCNPITTMEHYIYKWNEICTLPEHDSIGMEVGWSCAWTACAKIDGCPGLPKFHAFKITFGSKEDSIGLYNAFLTSVAVAEQIGCYPSSGLHSL